MMANNLAKPLGPSNFRAVNHLTAMTVSFIETRKQGMNNSYRHVIEN